MAVIYEDAKQNPWAGVGQGLQGLSQIVQGIQQARQQAKEKQLTQAIIAEKDPGKQADMAMRFLGPDKGGDLVQKLTQARLAPLALGKAQLDQQLQQVKLAGETETNREMPMKFQLAQQEAQAKTLAANSEALRARAEAAGVPAKTAHEMAETAEVRARTAQINSEVQAKAHFASAFDALLKGAGPDTVVPAPNDPTKPAAVQPKHVASITDFALGKTKNVADVDLPPVPIVPGNRVHMTPEEIQEAQALAASGDIVGAHKMVAGAQKITSRADVTLAPGFKVKMGYRDDGSSVQLSAPRYEPNKANLSVDSRTAQGIALWNATVEGIKQIAQDPKTGPESTRKLMDTVHTIAPWVDLKTLFPTSAKNYYDWKSQAAHALVAASGLMAGARGGQMLLKSLQDTIPKPGQPDSEIMSNLAASRRITDSMAKDFLGSLIADGKAVPEEIKEISFEGNLGGKTSQEIAKEGLGDGGAEGGGKEAPGAGGEGGRAGEAGEGRGVGAGENSGASTGAGADIKSQVIGGKLITPEYLQKIAQDHGITPEEALEGLKRAAGQQ